MPSRGKRKIHDLTRGWELWADEENYPFLNREGVAEPVPLHWAATLADEFLEPAKEWDFHNLSRNPLKDPDALAAVRARFYWLLHSRGRANTSLEWQRQADGALTATGVENGVKYECRVNALNTPTWLREWGDDLVQHSFEYKVSVSRKGRDFQQDVSETEEAGQREAERELRFVLKVAVETPEYP